MINVLKGMKDRYSDDVKKYDLIVDTAKNVFEKYGFKRIITPILEETERKTRNKSIKFLKVKWSHHSDREATWEHEDHLRSEYPEFFQS